MKQQIACITGGTGFFGRTLAQKLITDHGYFVHLIDFSPPPDNDTILASSRHAITFSHIDIRDLESLKQAFKGASIVFHIASYGMSGSSQLRPGLIYQCNVVGTQNVITACIAHNIERLIFTSSYNVCFGGQSITAGDESLPYFPLHKHVDQYSKTKAMAEMLVLQANATPLSSSVLSHDNELELIQTVGVTTRAMRRGSSQQSADGGNVVKKTAAVTTRNVVVHGVSDTVRYLRTCAVRPAAIWGYGEMRHLPRVVDYVERGLFCFTFGRRDAKMDFVHVNNLVQAHILAAAHLLSCNDHQSAGQAYFISDGEHRAMNNFVFFGHLVKGLGYSMPKINLPLWLIYYIAYLTEKIHRAVHPYYPFEPLLTRAEVFKAGVNHWFLMDKAREELGYAPVDHDLSEMAAYFIERGLSRRDGVSKNSWILLAVFEVVLLFLLVFMIMKVSWW